MRLDEVFRLIYKELDNDDMHEIRNINITGYSVNEGEVHFMSLLVENDEGKYKNIIKPLYSGGMEDDGFECEAVYRNGSGKKLI